jgi:hypothetical protein
MNHFRTLLFPVLFALILTACKSACDCYADKGIGEKKNSVEQPWVVREINTEGLAALVMEKKYNDLFGFHLFKKEQDYLFAFVSAEDSLIIYDLANKKKIGETGFQEIIKGRSYYNALFVSDTLYLVDTWQKRYYRFILQHDWEPVLLDSADINGYENAQNCELYPHLWGHGLTYRYPDLLIHYGAVNKKNYIDTKAYLKINTVNKSILKIIDYPACYHCSFVYDNGSSVIFRDNGSVACLFNQYDQLYLWGSEETAGKSFSLIHKCGYWTFKKNAEQNLAYVRKYEANGERNMNLFNISDRYYTALKHNAKPDINSKNQTSVFVFDSSFNQVYSTIISHPLFMPAIFNYKDGLLFFNDSLSKAYYYDFRK